MQWYPAEEHLQRNACGDPIHMPTKQTKKRWLLEKLQVSAAALTISTVFVLAPVNAEAVKSDAAPPKQTIANRIAHIREQLKHRQEHADQTATRDVHERGYHPDSMAQLAELG